MSDLGRCNSLRTEEAGATIGAATSIFAGCFFCSPFSSGLPLLAAAAPLGETGKGRLLVATGARVVLEGAAFGSA